MKTQIIPTDKIWRNHNQGGLKVKPQVKALRFGFTVVAIVIAIFALAVVAAPAQIARSEGPQKAAAAVAWDTDGNNIAGGDFLGTTNSKALVFKVNNTERMRISNNGNVGIGTTSPTAKLDVQGGPVNIVNPGQGKALLSLGSERPWVFRQFGTGAPTALELTAVDATNNNKNFLINTTGRVGIGTTAPTQTLDVNGGAAVSVLIIRGGADLAENFHSTDFVKPEPGTVMIIDEQNEGKLKTSSIAYDRKVVGIVSGAGNIKTGVTLQQEGVMDGDLPVTVVGRVYCKAEALNGAIQPGDLVTTSTMPGYCMKASDNARANGATIGKAMTGLKTGTGLVLVLVNLQ